MSRFTIGVAVLGCSVVLFGATPAAAQNCSIFTGGNPCNAGCPDECSPLLCPGNALCRPQCGGSSCNVGCNPGPCGSGCPDECSRLLCPQNHCRARCNAAPQCDLLCGGDPCGDGCPDECSPIVCTGNALCRSQCGGSACNVGCDPGPCGSGCPDECSRLLCPQNHCTLECNDVPECDLLCGGDPCRSGCPDECNALVCPFDRCVCAEAGEACGFDPVCCHGLVCAIPQLTCRHDPPEAGEPCSLFVPCKEGLRCINLVCERPRTIGEGCLTTADCADGLDCRACFAEGCNAPFMCFAQSTLPLFDEETCLSFHSPDLQRTAADAGLTMSYGYGTALAAGVGVSIETGTVYGAEGRYGCYMTNCLGGALNVGIADFVSVGFYLSYDDFRGTSIATVQEAGVVLAFSTSQVFNLMGGLIGTASGFSVGAGVAPITAGVYQCTTVADTFIHAPTPTSSPVPTRTPAPSPGVPTSTSTPVAELDYGDAPEMLDIPRLPGRPDPSYPTLRASDGARHRVEPGFFLGERVDTEWDGQPETNATGDDLAGEADEDGVLFATRLRAGGVGRIQVVSSAEGRMDAWLDFDADGTWNQPREHIFDGRELHAGVNVLTFPIPADAALGPTFARFRLSRRGGLGFAGDAPDGEVEDYKITIDGPPAGDANCDGAATAADLPSLLQSIGTEIRAACRLDDANADGNVDQEDVITTVGRIFSP